MELKYFKDMDNLDEYSRQEVELYEKLITEHYGDRLAEWGYFYDYEQEKTNSEVLKILYDKNENNYHVDYAQVVFGKLYVSNMHSEDKSTFLNYTSLINELLNCDELKVCMEEVYMNRLLVIKNGATVWLVYCPVARVWIGSRYRDIIVEGLNDVLSLFEDKKSF